MCQKCHQDSPSNNKSELSGSYLPVKGGGEERDIRRNSFMDALDLLSKVSAGIAAAEATEIHDDNHDRSTQLLSPKVADRGRSPDVLILGASGSPVVPDSSSKTLEEARRLWEPTEQDGGTAVSSRGE